jgi:hypothetical protein
MTGWRTRYGECSTARTANLGRRDRRPYRHAKRLPFQIEQLILQFKEKHPSLGAQKIRDKITLVHSSIQLSAISTVHAVLYRRGLVRNGDRPRYKLKGTSTRY